MNFEAYYIGIFLAAILSLSYFFIGNRNNATAHSLIFSLLIIVLICEGAGRYMKTAGNNHLIYNIFFVYVETYILLAFFYLIAFNKKIKMIIVSGAVLLLLFGIINSIYFQPFKTVFHNYSLALGSLFLLFLCIQFFMSIFSSNKYADENLMAVPYFWIVTGILFFYSSSFLYFASIQFYTPEVKDLYLTMNALNRLVAVLMYLIFGLAFYSPKIFRKKLI